MATETLTRIRLANGVWEGLFLGRNAQPPRLQLRHLGEFLGELEASPAADKTGWLVKFRLPLDRLSDGAQTFVIEDAQTGAALAHETIIAGDDAAADLRAELSVLRDELDLLKRAFRTHCAAGD